MKTQHRHFWVLIIVLVVGGGIVHFWDQAGEARVERRALKDFPSELGSWKQLGGDTRFNAETEAVLLADDYVMRDYALPNGRGANFYVGYYATQRGGATYHSPLNCLPGSGWRMTGAETINITPADGKPAFEANRYIIQNGETRQMLIYWYDGRGRAVASEYWDKVYTVLDSVSRRRSDGSMVRVIVPVGASESEALETATGLAAQAATHLRYFVPE